MSKKSIEAIKKGSKRQGNEEGERKMEGSVKERKARLELVVVRGKRNECSVQEVK